MVEKILSFISIDEKINDKQYRFISSDLKKILNKAILISSTKGFPIDLNNAESGRLQMKEIFAEFLFIARAIIAGFPVLKLI